MSEPKQQFKDPANRIIRDTVLWMATLLGPDMDGAQCIYALQQVAKGVEKSDEEGEPAFPPASPTKPGMNVAEFREWLATQDQEAIVCTLVASQIRENGVPEMIFFDPEKHSHHFSPSYHSYSTLLIGGI